MSADDRVGVWVPRWAMDECDGDARDAMVLAQITWWLQPRQRDGAARTSRFVERDGEQWMHTTDAELATDVSMSADQVYRARRSLMKRGLIVSKATKVNGAKRTLIRPALTAESRNSATAESRDQLFGESAESRARARSKSLNHVMKIANTGADGSFAAFWESYPRHEAKGRAETAWSKATKTTDPGTIIAGACRYRDDPNRDPAYTKHPATWLTARCWEDDPLPPRNGNGNGHRNPMAYLEEYEADLRSLR